MRFYKTITGDLVLSDEGRCYLGLKNFHPSVDSNDNADISPTSYSTIATKLEDYQNIELLMHWPDLVSGLVLPDTVLYTIKRVPFIFMLNVLLRGPTVYVHNPSLESYSEQFSWTHRDFYRRVTFRNCKSITLYRESHPNGGHKVYLQVDRGTLTHSEHVLINWFLGVNKGSIKLEYTSVLTNLVLGAGIYRNHFNLSFEEGTIWTDKERGLLEYNRKLKASFKL